MNTILQYTVTLEFYWILFQCHWFLYNNIQNFSTEKNSNVEFIPHNTIDSDDKFETIGSVIFILKVIKENFINDNEKLILKNIINTTMKNFTLLNHYNKQKIIDIFFKNLNFLNLDCKKFYYNKIYIDFYKHLLNFNYYIKKNKNNCMIFSPVNNLEKKNIKLLMIKFIEKIFIIDDILIQNILYEQLKLLIFIKKYIPHLYPLINIFQKNFLLQINECTKLKFYIYLKKYSYIITSDLITFDESFIKNIPVKFVNEFFKIFTSMKNHIKTFEEFSNKLSLDFNKK